MFVSVLEYPCAVSFEYISTSWTERCRPWADDDKTVCDVHCRCESLSNTRHFKRVKFLLFCLGSLEKYPKIGFPQCKLNNSIDYNPFCAGNLSF
jgi:hypothetical protein